MIHIMRLSWKKFSSEPKTFQVQSTENIISSISILNDNHNIIRKQIYAQKEKCLPDNRKQAVIEYVQIDRLLPYKLDVCNEAFQEHDHIVHLLESIHDQDIQHTRLWKKSAFQKC